MRRSNSTRMKEAFKDTWHLSEKKENFVTAQIMKIAGVPVRAVGFGAGTTDYIEGSSGANGFEKAAPDLEIPGSNIRIEVTGPLRALSPKDDLFINVEKVKFALDHPELEYWIAHVNGVTSKRESVRMIRVGKLFRQGMDRGEILRVGIHNRGVNETFWSVPPDHYTVTTFDRFLKHLSDNVIRAS